MLCLGFWLCDIKQSTEIVNAKMCRDVGQYQYGTYCYKHRGTARGAEKESRAFKRHHSLKFQSVPKNSSLVVSWIFE